MQRGFDVAFDIYMLRAAESYYLLTFLLVEL